MSVYPNPSSGIFNFRLIKEMETDVNIMVMDIQGKEITRRTMNGKSLHEESIDLSFAEKGIYILKVECGDKVFTKKIQLN